MSKNRKDNEEINYKNKNYENKQKFQNKREKKTDIRNARINSHKYSNYSEEEIYFNGLNKYDNINNSIINNEIEKVDSKEILNKKKEKINEDLEKEVEENKKINQDLEYEEEYEEYSPDYFEPKIYNK
jgi:hypothetical protein